MIQPFERTWGDRLKSIVLGLIIILYGKLYLLFQLGYIAPELWEIVFSWPMILISIGLVNLMSRRSFIFGSILLIIGVAFQLPVIFDIQFDLKKMIIPTIVIVIGLFIVLKSLFFSQVCTVKKKDLGKNESETMNSSMNDIDSLKINAIFGGVKKNFSSSQFKGGNINAIFGGAEIDMRQAALAPGINRLEMNCILGGASLLVPAEWDVKIEATTILGGFADERKISIATKGSGSLIITGIAVLGGGEIKS